MTVWIVIDGDYDGDWIVAVYDSETVANEHAELSGLHVERADVLTAISPAAVDTRPERAAAAEAFRAHQADQAERNLRHQKWRETYTLPMVLARGGRPALCRCVTFSTDSNSLTPHGYCEYCGGWTFSVFREHMGEQALSDAIDLLAYSDRVQMRAITGLATV